MDSVKSIIKDREKNIPNYKTLICRADRQAYRNHNYKLMEKHLQKNYTIAGAVELQVSKNDDKKPLMFNDFKISKLLMKESEVSRIFQTI